jgi:hypothetical protein
VFFYELHEGDDDVFSDILLAREERMDPDQFFEIVQGIRRKVRETYEQDTLIEAIAEELEQDHEFIFISDDRLTAAVNVAAEDEDNFLVDLDEDGSDEADTDEDVRTIVAEYRRDSGGGLPN